MNKEKGSAKGFQRKIEDFTCNHCGLAVKGSGYTNHCPACLWSQHVDIHPGDRAASCGGMMEPVRVEVKGGQYSIVHKCQTCGAIRKIRSSTADNFDALVAIAQR